MKNNEHRNASKQIKNTTNRNSRLKKGAIRGRDDARIASQERFEHTRSFRDYAEMRGLSEAGIIQRAGDAAKAAWGAWSGNNAPKKRPKYMLSSPEDGHFHNAELDMVAISDLADKMKTPELQKAVRSLAIKATQWFRDGAKQAKPQQQQGQQQPQQGQQQVQPQQQQQRQPQQVQPQQQQRQPQPQQVQQQQVQQRPG